MPSRAIGLDVGTHAVRAAELTLGRDTATLQRFGQVVLPPGAVVDGEVVDAPTVAAAIRRLWAEVGFRNRNVVVGVANPRVVVRQAELPALSEEDLRSALQFEAQELIPLPVEEAILDFQVLGQGVDAEGQPTTRILLVAAQRDMVRSLVAAVESAGLSASMVDLQPFALIRSLAGPDLDLREEGPGTEAIVCVGAGITNVVVHERGVPRFVRMLVVGGNEVTEAIAGELGVDRERAEDLKRRADPASADPLAARAGRIVNDRIGPFVEEVRGSLDFYAAQGDAPPVARVVLTGGGSRLPGLVERLREALGAPVELGRPLERVNVGRIGISPDRLAQSEALLAVPLGLAEATRPLGDGLRRMTLLPRETIEVRAQRRQSAMVLAGVGALAVVLVLLWLARGGQESQQNDRAARAARETAQLQRQAANLSGATALEAQLSQRRALVTKALSDDVAWTRLLNDIATAMPDDVWLTSFTGGKPGSSRTTASANANGLGTVTISAMGFDHSSTARWLLRVGDLSALTGLWVPSSARSNGPNAPVSFTSTATLTPAAHDDRSGQFLGTAG